MGISVTRFVKFIRKGKGVIIAQSPTVWSYTETQWKNYYCTNGRSLTWKPISNVSDFTVGDTMVINGVVSDKDNITISLYTKVVSIDEANQAITAQSQNYIISGEDGKDAVTVYVDPPTILHKKAATKSTYSIGFKVKDGANYVTEVSTNNAFTCVLQTTSLPTGISYSYKMLRYDEIRLVFIVEANAVVNTDLSFKVTYKGVDYVCTVPFKTVADGQTGGKGDRGPALRGPQMWEECAVGYVFMQGKDGEDFKDIVIYNGNYYSCIKSHAKTADNAPGSTTDTNNGYWKLSDKFEVIATKILLAQYALVKNLGVETIDMRDSAGNIIFQAKDGNVICNSGTFRNIKVTGDSEFSGTMKAVSGSFKSLNCVNNNGDIVGNITFGSDGRMWFDGDMYSQGYRNDKDRSNRFYTSDVWCRGMFGHYEKTMAVVKGTYMYVYSKGADKSGVYVSLKTGQTADGKKTYYKIPLYGLDGDIAGMPIDVVVFNTSSDYYYQFTGTGNGKEWRVINGNDKQTIHFCDIGGWHTLAGGCSVNCMYVNPEWLNPKPDTAGIGRGVFWTGETDLNW